MHKFWYLLILFLTGSRLHDLVIATTNISLADQAPDPASTSHQVCTTYPGPGVDNDIIHLKCTQPVWGRYFFIQIIGTESMLSLCEVDIWEGRDFIYFISILMHYQYTSRGFYELVLLSSLGTVTWVTCIISLNHILGNPF